MCVCVTTYALSHLSYPVAAPIPLEFDACALVVEVLWWVLALQHDRLDLRRERLRLWWCCILFHFFFFFAMKQGVS